MGRRELNEQSRVFGELDGAIEKLSLLNRRSVLNREKDVLHENPDTFREQISE